MPLNWRLPALALAAVAALSSCAVGPDYHRPALDLPPAYKEDGPWKPAEPQPVSAVAPWWEAYGDATLAGLLSQARQANQDLALAEAQYRQAVALASAARAGFWPTVGADASVTRARARSSTGGAAETTLGGLDVTASWQPDLWGGVRRSVEAGEAGAQASADDYAAARLSIESTLAQDYVQLRITDDLIALYATTTAAYDKALALTRAQHAAGVTLLSDVALAESQLATAQAAGVDLQAQRAALEHAIAVLTGRSPARFTLDAANPAQPFAMPVPATPAGLPSTLLEHRPDIAAAERRAAQANADIGVARAAWYPNLLLSGSGGFSAATLGTLFDTPSRVWSLGASLAGTLFDGGLRRAQDAQAVAAYDAAVAQYKQTVLAGFQQVEDNLAALRFLDREAVFQAQAVRSAGTAERLALAQYRAGTTSYLSVITAQTLSLERQRAAVTLRGRQLVASIGLVVATGGGWSAADPALPPPPSLAPTAAPEQAP